MKRSALLPWVLVFAACASPSWRSALEGRADRPAVEQAELSLVGGDAAGAATKAEEVLAASDDVAKVTRAFFALVVASDALGELERPLPYLARAIDLAAGEHGDPAIAARLAAESGRAWARLDGRDARSVDVADALRRLAERKGDTWEDARSRALRELVQAERLAHGVHAARLAAERAGFVLRWRLSAPWGEAPMLDFLAPLGPETRPLAAAETTGASWDLVPVPTTDETFSDGEVTFFDLPATGGVGFAEADLADGPARRLVLRLESNRLCEVRVDGTPVVVRGDAMSAWLHVAEVVLPAGPHRLTAKLASVDGRGFFRVQLADLPLGDATAPTAVEVVPPAPSPSTPARPRPGDARAVVAALLEIEDLVSRPRWDPEAARARLDTLEAALGSLDSVSVDLLAARLALGDTAAPPAERRQTARARYEAVLAKAPGQPVATRGLARIEREEERPDRALALLRGEGQGAPSDRRTALELLDLYRDRGWEVEALTLVADLGGTMATSPRLLQETVDTYEAFGRRREAEEVARVLEERFPGSGVERLHQLAADRGEVDPDRPRALFSDEPQRHALIRAAVADLRRLGRLDEADEIVEAFRRMRPRDGWALAERVKIALQRDDRAAAIARADEALALAPDFAPMEELRALLSDRPETFDDIADGRAIVAGWRALANQPAAAAFAAYPIIVLLDRSAVSVRADGSTVELEHRVRLVQTKQGADELGDARPPDGARLLVARTLKADGRVLEPERTEGKPDLSFPDLQPGDAVETAWVTRSRVAPSEGGYLTGFAFASWGAPIVALEAEVDAAPGLALELTSFGGAPEPVRGPDGSSFRWKLAMLPPVQREPLSLSPRSFFPFADVRVARAATPPAERDPLAWRAIGRAYAARIAALGLVGPRTSALAARLSRDPHPIAGAFEWVKTEVSDIEQLNAFETPVEAAVGNEKGNRALVLATVLRAMKVPAELVLCAPERDGPPEDRAHPTPNPNRFFYPVVVTPEGPLDPARPYTPAGDVPAELVGAACLAPGPDGGSVRTLERAGPAEPSFESTLTLVLDEHGDARGTLVGLARGAAASPLRQAYLAQDEERQRIIFEQWLASLAVGARLVDFAVEDAADGEAPMRWRLSIELPGWAVVDGDALVVRRPLKPLVHADFAGVNDLAQLVALPERTTPLRVLPFSEAIVLDVRAPGRALVSAPPEVTADAQRGGLSQHTKIEGDRAVITRTARWSPGRVSPAEYGAFRAAAGQAIRAFETALRFAPR